MKAVVCEKFGEIGDLRVDDVATPEPKADEARVRIMAAGVNWSDALMAQGRYQFKPDCPFSPGQEAAGVIDAVGDNVCGLESGMRVAVMVQHGAFASAVVAKADQIVPIPDTLDFPRAATTMQTYGTALFALEQRAGLVPNDTLLVTGAGGGAGLAAIDVGKALGATVIAAASSPEKRTAAINLGADFTIDYTTDTLKERTREITGGSGADVVYDTVGGEHAVHALRAASDFGRYLIVGFAGGEIPQLPSNYILLGNRSAIGVDWGSLGVSDTPMRNKLVERVLELVADDVMHPPRPAEYPLEDAVKVLTDMQARKTVGKIVLEP